MERMVNCMGDPDSSSPPSSYYHDLCDPALLDHQAYSLLHEDPNHADIFLLKPVDPQNFYLHGNTYSPNAYSPETQSESAALFDSDTGYVVVAEHAQSVEEGGNDVLHASEAKSNAGRGGKRVETQFRQVSCIIYLRQ
jgi:hypothetical protein